jgi:hypothetical protein
MEIEKIMRGIEERHVNSDESTKKDIENLITAVRYHKLAADISIKIIKDERKLNQMKERLLEKYEEGEENE